MILEPRDRHRLEYNIISRLYSEFQLRSKDENRKETFTLLQTTHKKESNPSVCEKDHRARQCLFANCGRVGGVMGPKVYYSGWIAGESQPHSLGFCSARALTCKRTLLLVCEEIARVSLSPSMYLSQHHNMRTCKIPHVAFRQPTADLLHHHSIHQVNIIRI